MSPLSLELGLGVLGLAMLLVESFGSVPRRLLAHAAIGGLTVALLILMFGVQTEVPASMAEFYTVDRLAVFYKALDRGH